MTEEEEFYAWLDGELDPDTAAKVEARVARDPALAELAAQHRAMVGNLRGAFDPLLSDAPAPPKFAGADVVELASRRAIPARRSFGWPQWAAMAATLVLGLVAGTMVRPDASGPVRDVGGKLYAAASLDQALDRQLASAQGDGAVRIGLTFRDQQGRTCRSFSGSVGQGLACRDGDDWAVEGLFARQASGGDYRMAAGDDPRIAAMIDERIAGEPYDAAAEARALKEGWR